MNVLLDETYDGMKDSLNALGHKAFTVREFRENGANLLDDPAIARYAKDHELIIVTQNDDMARICKASDTDVLHLDFAILAKVIDSELKSKFSS